ncbi:hypothetical protein [Klebsiella sp. RIT-PI-d]|uniref:hypothetical protein n=1 Tax=Klebsiella sp. RIT-PI-d TaxID=1681196 RepID=UPI000676A451|nr:hypothetical protein [Klebsiella sp. RIT-PI-d]
MPVHANDSQIKYYDQSGNANTDDSAKSYSDIFVVNGHSGGYYQQGDWQPGQAQFRDLKGITGNGGVAQGDAGKDYIFVAGNSGNYNVSYSSNNNDSTQNNTYDGVKITDKNTGKSLYENANHIEGVVFGDGTSSGTTTTTVTPNTVQHVTLDIHVSLDSHIPDAHLTQITLSGIPQGATFTGNYTSVTWDHGIYTLTLNGTGFNGQVSVNLPDGMSKLGDIKMSVDSTVEDRHDTDFTIDGENGTHFVYDSMGATHDMQHSEAASHAFSLQHSDSSDTTHDRSDTSTQTDAQKDHQDEYAQQTDGERVQTDDLHPQVDTQNGDHKTTDDSHQTAGLIDDSELHLDHAAESPHPAGAEPGTHSAVSEDTSLSNLLDNGHDEHTSHGQNAEFAGPDHVTADHTVSSILTADDPIQLSDVISDTNDSNDLTHMIPTIAPGPMTDADHHAGIDVNAPPGHDVSMADSYHTGDESLVENLMAKPEELHG